MEEAARKKLNENKMLHKIRQRKLEEAKRQEQEVLAKKFEAEKQKREEEKRRVEEEKRVEEKKKQAGKHFLINSEHDILYSGTS
jgi:hypothetical protein